ncbi:hypothetical protein Sjap_019615 [Stephania japonica]|uniref:Ninja-family protein n=1 Tax=Stephania japonica TaxID=461633 RepID=A0AAP0HZI6_9MAGN
MEDDNGLELSLGLSCGGSAGKAKAKDGGSLDAKADEGSSSGRSISDFKNFLNTGVEKQDSINMSPNVDQAHSGVQNLQENFFTSLSKSPPVGDKSPEVEEIKSSHNEIGGKMWNDSGNKRKMLFEEMGNSKKHERESMHADSLNKSPFAGGVSSARTPHVSVTTEDGSTAENEDVADSEVDGSTSRLALHPEEVTKRFMVGGSSSTATQGNHEHKRSNGHAGIEPKHRNLTYGSMLPVTSFSSKMANVAGEPDASVYPLSPMVQLRPPVSNESSGLLVNPGNMPLTFGYSPVQLPTLDTSRSWGLLSHTQNLSSPFAGRGIGSVIPSSDNSEDGLKIPRATVHATPHSSSEALPDGRKPSDLLKSGKVHGGLEAGPSSSSQTEDEVKRHRLNQSIEGLSNETAVIRPGLASGLKFGGCGSYPDLPWVSTTGSGPNGRTISGVTYRYDNNQIKIVCACHGSHMSPEEFVQHASADSQSSENNIALASFPGINPAASTHS